MFRFEWLLYMGSKKTRLLANDFLSELVEGKFASADRALQKIRSETVDEAWQKGYVNALEGMLLASQSRNDKFAFIANIDSKRADKFAKMFGRISKDKMQSEFDRGFFSAWADYVQALKDSSRSKMDWYSGDSSSESRGK